MVQRLILVLMLAGTALPALAGTCAKSNLVRGGTWTERRNRLATEVRGEIWSDAIQACLDHDRDVRLAAKPTPYYLDKPLIIRSGSRFTADPSAELRLVPGTNTCMIRNQHIVSGEAGPPDPRIPPDSDITIAGGIWTTLSPGKTENNGNIRGRADASDSAPGAHGVILLSNVRDVVVQNLTVRESRPFGVHISNAAGFRVENLRFENHWRDGVHINGPASHGVIRHLRGVTHDDFVALNAWDWHNYAPTFGPITDLTIEDIAGDPARLTEADARSPYSDGSADIRLLAGVKRFRDGRGVECGIGKCTFRGLRNIRSFKLYDQPNLEDQQPRDASDRIGKIFNVAFEDLEFSRAPSGPPFLIHADVDHLLIRDVILNFLLRPDFRLVQIGPMSATYKGNFADPEHWIEIFSPDRDCTVRSLQLSRITTGDGAPVRNPDRLVEVVNQKLNPEYPASTPKGGTGRCVLIR